MISSISNPGYALATQSAQNAMPKGLSLLQSKTSADAVSTLDTYERADGTVATRNDNSVQTDAKDETAEDKRFRDVLQQVVGQTFFGQMLKAMRATQEKNPYFDGGRAEEIFQGQLDQIITEKMSKASGQSLSDPMYRLMKARGYQ